MSDGPPTARLPPIAFSGTRSPPEAPVGVYGHARYLPGQTPVHGARWAFLRYPLSDADGDRRRGAQALCNDARRPVGEVFGTVVSADRTRHQPRGSWHEPSKECEFMAPNWPPTERRVSGVRDRRLIYRGGRRSTDRVSMSRPTPDIACSICRVGLATVDTITYEDGRRITVYVCPACGHRQYRITHI